MSGKTFRMIKDGPTAEKGRIKDFDLITHKHTHASPFGSLLCHARTRQVCLCLEVRMDTTTLRETPCWDNPGDSAVGATAREEDTADIAKRVKGSEG